MIKKFDQIIEVFKGYKQRQYINWGVYEDDAGRPVIYIYDTQEYKKEKGINYYYLYFGNSSGQEELVRRKGPDHYEIPFGMMLKDSVSMHESIIEFMKKSDPMIGRSGIIITIIRKIGIFYRKKCTFWHYLTKFFFDKS